MRSAESGGSRKHSSKRDRRSRDVTSDQVASPRGPGSETGTKHQSDSGLHPGASLPILASRALAGERSFLTRPALRRAGGSEPVKSAPEYFVSAEGDSAHLWVREGTTLRVVGHGTCKDCPPPDEGHEHEEGDGHHHAKPGAKK